MHRHPCPPTPSGTIGDEITGADQRRPYPFLGRSIGPASGDFPGAGPLSCPCARWGKPYGSPHARPPLDLAPRNRGRGSARRASNPARAAAASRDTDPLQSASAAAPGSGPSGPPCPAPSGVISPFHPMRPFAPTIRRRIGTGGERERRGQFNEGGSDEHHVPHRR